MTKAMNRRQFLWGAGGAVLAIPFLPSLAKKAFAADPGPGEIPKRFFAVGTGHGNIWGTNMYPAQALLMQSMSYAGRTVRFGPLMTNEMNGMAAISPCLMSNANALTPSLATKFNVLRGLDIPYRIGHHEGGFLGNFAANEEKLTGGLSNSAFMAATVDQVMAYSPNFYSQEDLSLKMTQRSFCVQSGEMSWNYSSPSTKTGGVVKQPAHTNNGSLFNYFFKPGTAYNNIDGVIIDAVKESFDRLKKDPRLSVADKVRLEQHVERMFEIERKLQVVANFQALPSPPAENSDDHYTDLSFNQNPMLNSAYCHLMNDIIVAAFEVGVFRIGTWRQKVRFAGPKLINDWHGNVGHEGYGPDEAQQWALAYNQGTFEHIMVDLAAKMDAVDMPDGSTLLDNSLLYFGQEAGQITHQGGIVNLPVVTAGGAGGFFKTGMFVDFSDKGVVYDDLDALIVQNPKIEKESPGLYMQQFLGTLLQSMGLAPAEYETFTDFTSGEPTKGFGFHYVDPKRAADYAQAKLAMGDKLPVIT
jgi:hypothetical protein